MVVFHHNSFHFLVPKQYHFGKLLYIKCQNSMVSENFHTNSAETVVFCHNSFHFLVPKQYRFGKLLYIKCRNSIVLANFHTNSAETVLAPKNVATN